MEGKTVRRVGQRLVMSWAALVMCAAVSGGDGTSTTPDKQPTTPAEAAPEQLALRFPRSVEPLPRGRTARLSALVIGVTGDARWRPSDKAPSWKDAEVNDLLYPGAQIRTASRSSITLRVGENATVMVDRLSKVDLPLILRDGDILRTGVALRHGRAHVKIDKIPKNGRTASFEMISPSGNSRARKTDFTVTWGALEGLEIEGLATNVIHAIEVRYLRTNRSYYLSGDGATLENQPDPVEVAFDGTISPTMPGELTEGEFLAELQDLRRVDYSRIGLAATLAFVSGFELPPPKKPKIPIVPENGMTPCFIFGCKGQ